MPGVSELAVLGLVALLQIFFFWMVVDCARHESDPDRRTLWLVLLLVFNALAAVAYFLTRRRSRRGSPSPSSPRS